ERRADPLVERWRHGRHGYHAAGTGSGRSRSRTREECVLRDEKILITGPAGRIAFGLARSLVAENEVWGIARFSDPSTREKVEALGVTTRAVDLASGEYGDLPTDFTHLLHLAADFSA